MDKIKYNVIDKDLRIGDYFIFGSTDQYEDDAQTCCYDNDGLIWSYHKEIDMILLNGMHRKYKSCKRIICKYLEMDPEDRADILKEYGLNTGLRFLLTEINAIQTLRDAKQDFECIEMPL